MTNLKEGIEFIEKFYYGHKSNLQIYPRGTKVFVKKSSRLDPNSGQIAYIEYSYNEKYGPQYLKQVEIL